MFDGTINVLACATELGLVSIRRRDCATAQNQCG
jgi:hypothetical protein